ncbi:resolvase [Leptolyngbya sp. FACHB-711]|uniref:resolvase n=1 Tax=Leptolyngbya sp. FACHB-711 TaxID=2692813 RepID=UPI00168A39E7|nr:resolvase [Leptolyngbya sp. FACHB-711]MBD2027554.1 resolvase [Leptolyngbya sp. FACHB-711]
MDDLLNAQLNAQATAQGLMTVEAVQKALNRSRASVYRYANTNPSDLNPSYDARKLNPELRVNKDDPLLFHPNEVARFAQDVLGIKQVTIEVQQPSENVTHDLLRAILTELQSLRSALKDRS